MFKYCYDGFACQELVRKLFYETLCSEVSRDSDYNRRVAYIYLTKYRYDALRRTNLYYL